MGAYTLETFHRMRFLEREGICGQMVKLMKENGSAIKCMVMECYGGGMGRNMKDFSKMIKEKVMESFNGVMDAFMRECGKMGNSMGEGNS